MAFDPKAFIAEPVPRQRASADGGFDPKAFLAEPVPTKAPPAEASGSRPGKLASFVRGAAQSASFGFADEAAGALNWLAGDGYTKGRDESRANYAAAQRANPGSYFAGELGGGVATAFVPGLGIAKGVGAAGVAGRAALAGAVGGVGGSEAQDAGGIALDAATSAGFGAATAGVAARVTRGAGKRVVNRMLGDITDGATATQRDRLVGKAGERVSNVINEMKQPAIKRAGQDPNKLLNAIEDTVDDVGQRLDGVFAKAGKATDGIKASDVIGRLETIHGRLAKDPGKADIARAVRSKIDDIKAAWMPDEAPVKAPKVRAAATPKSQPAPEMVQESLPLGGRKEIKRIGRGEDGRFTKADPLLGYDATPGPGPYQRAMSFGDPENWIKTMSGAAAPVAAKAPAPAYVSAQQVRVLAKDIGDVAFAGSPAVSPKQGKVVSQEVWGELKGLIDKNINESAKAIGGAGAKELKALNTRMSTLINMREAVRYKATREATESTRLKDRISGGLDLGLALTDPSTFVAKKAYDFVGKPALRAADVQIAKLVEAARNGSTPAKITQMAAEMGVARATGESIAQWAAQKFGGSQQPMPTDEAP